MHSLIALGLLFIFVDGTYTTATAKDCEQTRCIAVVDAGSSGSRIHIFSYDLDATNTPIGITERWSKKIEPGLASLQSNTRLVANYLSNLFQEAPKYTAPIPTYIYATAGMRALSKTKQEEFYKKVKIWFGKHKAWKLKSAKTISGSEEGLLGWLSVNYQLDNFKYAGQAVGVMDMGGASVQITFPIQSERDIDENDIQKVNVYGQEYALFVHSFLGLGQDYVSQQFVNALSCFPNNYSMSAGQLAAGNVYACKDEMIGFVNNLHHVNKIVAPALMASNEDKWYVMGGLAAQLKSKPFSFVDETFTQQNLMEQTETEICTQDWQHLHAQFPNNSFLSRFCLTSAYYYALTVDGYGFQPHQPLRYLGPDKTENWTIGVVLNHKE